MKRDSGAGEPRRAEQGSVDHHSTREDRAVSGVRYEWRGAISDREMVALVESHGGSTEAGWWDRIRPYSLGWVVAREDDDTVVGFVNVAWDGGEHAFLIDTKVPGEHQRRGLARPSSRRQQPTPKPPDASGCMWTSRSISDTSTLTLAGSDPLTLG